MLAGMIQEGESRARIACLGDGRETVWWFSTDEVNSGNNRRQSGLFSGEERNDMGNVVDQPPECEQRMKQRKEEEWMDGNGQEE